MTGSERPPGAATAAGAVEEALHQTLDALQLPLHAGQRGLLLRYVELLQRWNGAYNLTAVRDPLDMATLHLADCLAVVPPLQRWAAGGLAGKRLLDVGSGAGLPGVVLAIVEPELEVVCVDAVGKKAAFVRQVAAELVLPNLLSLHGRVEKLEPSHAFDVIASRAFATLAGFFAQTRPLLAGGGVWMAMKGRRPDEELRALPPSVDVFHVEQLRVPGLDAARSLVWARASP